MNLSKPLIQTSTLTASSSNTHSPAPPFNLLHLSQLPLRRPLHKRIDRAAEITTIQRLQAFRELLPHGLLVRARVRGVDHAEAIAAHAGLWM